MFGISGIALRNKFSIRAFVTTFFYRLPVLSGAEVRRPIIGRKWHKWHPGFVAPSRKMCNFTAFEF